MTNVSPRAKFLAAGAVAKNKRLAISTALAHVEASPAYDGLQAPVAERADHSAPA
jgi:hypothetical protein